ncbi:hypothetical protein [Paracoccus siganidrum]|uniref:hypothetical protein n=1 Tax=Paracoccus siganidrum TaxID=1276757 RepID=UPI001474B8C4|nr:hypothetical protein [Paracoccus siganidrum]
MKVTRLGGWQPVTTFRDICKARARPHISRNDDDERSGLDESLFGPPVASFPQRSFT